MRTVIAVGGGEIEDGGTLPIDKEIVNSTGKSKPEVLFIPTASEDSENYVEKFENIYRDRLGCKTDVLLLIEDEIDESTIESKIERADLVYVGGGNTRKMLDVWKDKNVDRYLKDACQKGTVMSGLSAGSICWFEHGHSDSESFENEDEDWDFIKINGLGIVEDVIFCPHYHADEREDSFQEMMKNNPENVGIAIDDNAAVKIKEDRIQIIKSDESGKAYRITHKDKEELETGENYHLNNFLN